MDYMTFPDAEAVVGWAIRTAEIGDLDGVYSSLPRDAFTASGPACLALVGRIGGVPANRHALDTANIQVSVYGPSKSIAHDVAQAARVAVHQLEGLTVGLEETSGEDAPVPCTVTAVRDALGLSSQPDSISHKDRYIFSCYLYTRTPREAV